MPHLSIWRRVRTSRRAASLARWKSWQAAWARNRGILLSESVHLGVGGGQQQVAHRALGHVGRGLLLPLLARHLVVALGQRHEALAGALRRPRGAERRQRAVEVRARRELQRRVLVLALQPRLRQRD